MNAPVTHGQFTVHLDTMEVIASGPIGGERFPRWDHPYWSKPETYSGGRATNSITLCAQSDAHAIDRARQWVEEFGSEEQRAALLSHEVTDDA